MVKLYMYKGCEACRRAKRWLTERGVRYEELALRENPPGIGELREALAARDFNLKKLFNVSGHDYRALGMRERLPAMSVDEALELLSTKGNLVKRPFLATERGCLSGFDPSEWENHLA